MASAPGVTIVRDNRTGQQQNLNFMNYTAGNTSPSVSIPVIGNGGFGGALTSGSLLYQTVGPDSPALLNWVNASGTITDRWKFSNSENRADAIALINAGVLAGTAYIVTVTSS
jgi:hypothetical protein